VLLHAFVNGQITDHVGVVLDYGFFGSLPTDFDFSFGNLENILEIWYIYSILNRTEVHYGERKQERGSCSLA
jgi:hypothetical protein